jgi:hypothetical protein
MLLQLDEREYRLLLDVLDSSLQTLREIDTAGYETMRQEREAVMVSLRQRMLARSSGARVDESAAPIVPL